MLFVGNPKPHKNLDNVVKAYAKALQIFEFEADLVCVGDREGMEFKVRQRAEQMGLGDRIRMVGHVPDEALPALYRVPRSLSFRHFTKDSDCRSSKPWLPVCR